MMTLSVSYEYLPVNSLCAPACASELRSILPSSCNGGCNGGSCCDTRPGGFHYPSPVVLYCKIWPKPVQRAICRIPGCSFARGADPISILGSGIAQRTRRCGEGRSSRLGTWAAVCGAQRSGLGGSGHGFNPQLNP
eukprot:6985850-Prymnesium_polylepis.1